MAALAVACSPPWALGALGGVLGGALAGPLGGKLVSEALNGVLPDIAVNALVGAWAGAGSGAILAGADYGMNCASSKDGCSLSGALDAMGSGALAGAIMGGLGGAGGGSEAAESGESGAGETPAVGESSDAAAGEATPAEAASAEAAPAEAAPAEEPEAASEEPSEDESSCPNKGARPAPHSFVGSTPVLMADGSTKPIIEVKIGDQIANSVPGDTTLQTHTVQNVIVTQTDRDFVDLTIKKLATKLGKAAAGVAVAVAAVLGSAAPASADTSTLTTTYHHPFYDITQAAFVDAVDLHPGDQLQTADGGTAEITGVRAYRQTQTTYDLTIDGLHTYHVLAGATPVLVHNDNYLEGCSVNVSSRTVTNSAGDQVVRHTVQNEDDLLAVADHLAGGSLDNFTNRKPDFWRGQLPDGTHRDIEFNLDGHANPPEGPHVKLSELEDNSLGVVKEIRGGPC